MDVPRPKASLISAQGNALGKAISFQLQANGLPHPGSAHPYEAGRWPAKTNGGARSQGVALGWYERRLRRPGGLGGFKGLLNFRKALSLAALFFTSSALAGLPLFQQFTNTLVMSNANVRVEYNLNRGRSDFFWQNSRKLTGFYAGVGLARYITGTVYSNRTWTVLSSNQVVVSGTASGLPMMKQYFIFDQDNGFLTRVAMESRGTNSNWMGPVVVDTTGGVDIGSYTDARALYVPFDNDHFVRYNAQPMNSTSTGYEVGAFYDNSSRNGLVVGSVTHDTWKTGVYWSGSNNRLDKLNVFGGAVSSSATWDVLPHGSVAGTNISSPTVFVGFGPDWRAVLESFADENALQVPKVPWTNGVPFGWNSWYAFGSTINHADAIAVSDFIKNNLQTNNFNNNGVVYVNLDSYWDNLSNAELVDFVNRCHSNGQKAGIYWSPFVWWGSPANITNATVEGSSYRYSDVALWTPGGILQTNDGAIAMDSTHPGIKQRMDYYLNQFISQGFDYIKLDFLSHGAMEGLHYDPNVTTGIQAYNQGMQYLFNKLNGRMFISESIAPLFPYSYAHSRRIACDTANTIGNTEYEMESVTYGWWLSGRLYQFNDPDLMEFAGATPYENQSRLISGAVSGTVFLNSDDLTSNTGQSLAEACLTNAAINAVARAGQTFRPVEGNTGRNAADFFVRQDPTNWYAALFNYTAGAVDKTNDLGRAGVPPGTVAALDLWSGALSVVTGGVLTAHLEAKQAKLFRLLTTPLLGPPAFTGLAATKTNVTVYGTNGMPGGTYRVLASTNLALPKTDWLQVGTSFFDSGGAFTFTLTNNPTDPQKFYLLEVP